MTAECAKTEFEVKVSDSPNPAHWSDEVDVGIGLVYGAAFGMLASHEDSRYSRFGQVLDDVERSCRFYEQDGKTVPLGRLQVYKRRGLDSKDS